MATVTTKLHIYPQSFDFYSNFREISRTRLALPGIRYGFAVRRRCRAFKSEEGDREVEEGARNGGDLKESEKGGILKSLRSAIRRVSFNDDGFKASMDKLEETLSSMAIQVGRYIVTMMSTGVVLGVGFQLSGGDDQMNSLIWYSWLGGVIIGTMSTAELIHETSSLQAAAQED